jgi:hypothetical protein
LGLSVALIDDAASRSRPAHVSWIVGNNRDCFAHRFVGCKGAKLRGPSRKTAALRLSRLNPLANMRQTSQRIRTVGAFHDSNNLVGTAMVGGLAEPRLLSAEAPHGALQVAALKRSLRAFVCSAEGLSWMSATRVIWKRQVPATPLSSASDSRQHPGTCGEQTDH